jgi:hypothetical protein
VSYCFVYVESSSGHCKITPPSAPVVVELEVPVAVPLAGFAVNVESLTVLMPEVTMSQWVVVVQVAGFRVLVQPDALASDVPESAGSVMV